MKSQECRLFFLIMALFALAALPAYANIGAPMIVVVTPVSWALLLPIIAIETAVAARIFGNGWGRNLRMVAVANGISTLVGIPVTWAILALVEILFFGTAQGLETPLQKLFAVTVQSPWLIPYESDLKWMAPAAAMSLCIPFFLASVWCENKIAKRMVPKEDWAKVKRWAWKANMWSYALIEGILVVFLLRGLI